MIKLEWSARKASGNLKKHGVSFDEAKSVFYDEYAVQFYDEDHSEEEDRFILLGQSDLSPDINTMTFLRFPINLLVR